MLLAATVFAACRKEEPAAGNRLMLVGDSIFHQSESTLDGSLRAAGWNPSVEAFPGTTIEFWSTDIVKALAKDNPNIIVIELGTNDCGTVPCVPLAPYIDALMRNIPSSIPVLWLTVQTDALIPKKPEYVNNEINAASGRWPNLWIVDMGSLFEGHNDWRSDGIHPNAEGQRQIAKLVEHELEPFKPVTANS